MYGGSSGAGVTKRQTSVLGGSSGAGVTKRQTSVLGGSYALKGRTASFKKGGNLTNVLRKVEGQRMVLSDQAMVVALAYSLLLVAVMLPIKGASYNLSERLVAVLSLLFPFFVSVYIINCMTSCQDGSLCGFWGWVLVAVTFLWALMLFLSVVYASIWGVSMPSSENANVKKNVNEHMSNGNEHKENGPANMNANANANMNANMNANANANMNANANNNGKVSKNEEQVQMNEDVMRYNNSMGNGQQIEGFASGMQLGGCSL
jgi:hypothetical protein